MEDFDITAQSDFNFARLLAVVNIFKCNFNVCIRTKWHAMPLASVVCWAGLAINVEFLRDYIVLRYCCNGPMSAASNVYSTIAKNGNDAESTALLPTGGDFQILCLKSLNHRTFG